MRRPQFTFRALLVAMLVVALLLAWVAHTTDFVRERKTLLQKFSGRLSVVHEAGVSTKPKELPWIRRMLGDEPIPALVDDLAEPDGEYVRRLRRLFPEARIMLRQEQYPPDSRLRRPDPNPDPGLNYDFNHFHPYPSPPANSKK